MLNTKPQQARRLFEFERRLPTSVSCFFATHKSFCNYEVSQQTKLATISKTLLFMRRYFTETPSFVGSVLLFLLPVCQCIDTFPYDVSYGRRGGSTRILQDTCSFDDLLSSACSLEEYCRNVKADQGIPASCSGDVSAEWNILIQFDELCYPSQVRQDSFARNIGDTQAELPESGFCSIESALLNFKGSLFESAEYQEIVTHPADAKGLIQRLTTYTPCDESVADTIFGQGYCADACPQTKLQASLQCGEQCIICSDGSQVLDCSNIHSTLVEECGNESAFVETLLAYLKAESSGSVPSSNDEEQNNSTKGDSDPLDELTATDSEENGDTHRGEQYTDQSPSVGGEGDVGSSNEPDVGKIDASVLESSGVLTWCLHQVIFVALLFIAHY